MVWIPVVSRGRRLLAISCWKHPQLHYKLGGRGTPFAARSERRSRAKAEFLYICALAFMKGNLVGGVVLLVVCRVTSLSSPSELVLKVCPQSKYLVCQRGPLSADVAVCHCVLTD